MPPRPISTAPPCDCGCTVPCGVRLAEIGGLPFQDELYGWYYCPVNEFSYWEVRTAGFGPDFGDYWNGDFHVGLAGSASFGDEMLGFRCLMHFGTNQDLFVRVNPAGVGLGVQLGVGSPFDLSYGWSGNMCAVQPNMPLTLTKDDPGNQYPTAPNTITVVPRGPTCACCPNGIYNGRALRAPWPTLTATLMNGRAACAGLNGLQIPLTFYLSAQTYFGSGSALNPAAYWGQIGVNNARCPSGVGGLTFSLMCVTAPGQPRVGFVPPDNGGWWGGFYQADAMGSNQFCSLNGGPDDFRVGPTSYRCDALAPMWLFQGIKVVGPNAGICAYCCDSGDGTGAIDVVVTAP